MHDSWTGCAYIQVFPCRQLFDALADIFETTPGFLEEIIDSFPDAVCLALCAQKVDLLAKSCDGGSETK